MPINRSLWLAGFSILGVLGCNSGPATNRFVLDREVNRLCAIDAGIRIYERVEVPPAFFNEYGQPKLRSKQYAQPSEPYYYEFTLTYLDENQKISRQVYRIVRRIDGKVLGESVRYGRRGGDLFISPMHDSSYSCPPIDTKPSIEDAVFYRRNDGA
jgi:hypothetical protein